MTKLHLISSMTNNFRGKQANFRGAFGPLSARFRGAFGVAFLAALLYEKSTLFSCFLHFGRKMHRSGKNGKAASYMHFNRTFIKGRYCVTDCYHGNT